MEAFGPRDRGLLFMIFAVAIGAAADPAAQPVHSRLMTLAADGSDPRVVYQTAERIEAPNWSPDGKWLVYNSRGRLFRIAADGGREPEPIPLGGITGANNDHVIAPDGASILFSAGGHIYVVPSGARGGGGGGTARRISNEHPPAERLIYWLHGISPDGKTAAFCGDRGGNKDIWAIPTAGGADRRLTDHPAADDGPDFTPDGKWIFFNSDRSGSNQIWKIPAGGGRAVQITADERANWFPHPSPDGRWIVYLSYPPGTEGHPADRDVLLRRMTPDGKDVRDLRRLTGGQGTINVPSWSPDSRRFAFVEYPG